MAAAVLIAKREGHDDDDDDEPADESTKAPVNNQFLAYVQETGEHRPLLYRKNGVLQGLEIELLKEIARRLGAHIVFKDAASLNYEEGAGIKRQADIICGVIPKTAEPPLGFSFSRAWATVTEGSIKQRVCFLFPSGSSRAAHIDHIIKALYEEDFVQKLAARGTK
jgi:hypothetical protein